MVKMLAFSVEDPDFSFLSNVSFQDDTQLQCDECEQTCKHSGLSLLSQPLEVGDSTAEAKALYSRSEVDWAWEAWEAWQVGDCSKDWSSAYSGKRSSQCESFASVLLAFSSYDDMSQPMTQRLQPACSLPPPPATKRYKMVKLSTGITRISGNKIVEHISSED
uniref:Uncharacterized protein n=1 Tax=Hanusia phi TaxID=3032 RepID=A0A7S0HPH4_9CRYP